MWKDLTQLASGFLYLGTMDQKVKMNHFEKEMNDMCRILKLCYATGPWEADAVGIRCTKHTYCSTMLLPPLLHCYAPFWGFPGGSDSKESACDAGDLDWSPGWEGPQGKRMATHSSILAWRIPWTEELGGLQYVVSQRVRHDWATNALTLCTTLK